MKPSNDNFHYVELEKYVGKTFYMDYNEIDVLFLLGGECAPPFFLCKWKWSDCVYTSDVMDVIVHFDDNYQAHRDTKYNR